MRKGGTIGLSSPGRHADNGDKHWEPNLALTFKGIQPHWGWSGSPLVVKNMLVVEPGGNGSSRAAVAKLTACGKLPGNL
jgi:hypothetical protein